MAIVFAAFLVTLFQDPWTPMREFDVRTHAQLWLSAGGWRFNEFKGR